MGEQFARRMPPKPPQPQWYKRGGQKIATIDNNMKQRQKHNQLHPSPISFAREISQPTKPQSLPTRPPQIKIFRPCCKTRTTQRSEHLGCKKREKAPPTSPKQTAEERPPGHSICRYSFLCNELVKTRETVMTFFLS